MSSLYYKNTITRQGISGGYNLDGVWIENPDGNQTEIVYCNVQPLNRESDRKNLPEGVQRDFAYNVRVPLDQPEISLSDPTQDVVGDEIIIDGDTYRAIKKDLWRNTRVAHNRYIMVRDWVKENQ